MTKQTIVIDGRILQTPTWSRGMGRYILSILMGLGQQDEVPLILVLFAEEFSLEEERLQVLNKVCPAAEVVVLPVEKGGAAHIKSRNAQIVDDYLAGRQIEDALFLQASLFTFDYSPFYPKTTVNTCIFYDMIPLKQWDVFSSYFPGYEYFSRYGALYEADKIFSISNAVKNDLIEYLGFRDEDIVNIDGADIPDVFQEGVSVSKKRPYDFKYLMLPGGDAPHKNMLRAIRGFDEFNAQFGDMFKLVITSFYSSDHERRMLELSPNIILTGHITDQELRNLYAHAELVFFPSLDEGLGLPVLEAVSYDKKVACSGIPVFKEISEDAFYYFNPKDTGSIARALVSCVLEDKERNQLADYRKISKKFTWSRTASIVLNSIIEKKPRRKTGKHAIVVEQDNSLELLKAISRVVRDNYDTSSVELFMDALAEEDAYGAMPLIFNHVLPTKDISDAPGHSGYDTRTIIYTPQSKYTKAIHKPSDKAIFVGIERKEVNKNFKEFQK